MSATMCRLFGCRLTLVTYSLSETTSDGPGYAFLCRRCGVKQ